MRIGELLRDVPKSTKGTDANQHKAAEKDTAVPLVTPKQQARESVGISRKQADRFVKLADYKEIIEREATPKESGNQPRRKECLRRGCVLLQILFKIGLKMQ